ncbi:baseplate wedge subunit [uncultured Caudovirales phage]|uniref:Baseplate wedge subunit n=1 Tax=uncultured Caudovirales phage TaxID=2100421 RepID=A0A6J5L382_9CAUD|nr:baseplate wedge subunit [uncultured Caudovirales phage]
MSTYNGFSTKVSTKKFSLADYELARQDLLNHFNIRKGQKLMQPNFGTIIWDLLFEPLDEHTQQVITDDVTKIINYDPRLRTSRVSITQQEHGFMIELTLTYIPTDQTETIALNFDRATSKLTVN